MKEFSSVESLFEDVTAALVDDPVCAGYLRPGAALLLWNRSGERLLWSSPSAVWLREAFHVDEEGRTDPALPAAERLQALGRSVAPRRGIRLERLWFDAGRLAPPVTCACRIVALRSGEEVLLTAPIGPVLKPVLRRPLGRPVPEEKS